MGKVFKAGYEHATLYQFKNMSVKAMYEALDAYKKCALANDSEYYLGIAKRIEDEIGDRLIGEAA